MRKRSLLLLMAAGLLAACSRDGADQGVSIRVVDEIRVADPFGGVEVQARGVQDAVVYLAPADTPRAQLGLAQRGWRKCRADHEGRCEFPGVEGLFHALGDLNGDRVIDGRAFDVRSGTSRTIKITTLAELGDAWLEISLANGMLTHGETAQFTLHGFVPKESTVAIEIWREGAKREQIKTLAPQTASQDVTYAATFLVESGWQATPPGKLNDYLIVPKIGARYFTGARFTVSSALPLLKANSITINNGAAVTDNRNAALTFSADNATFMTFSESVSTLTTALRFPYFASSGFALSAGDGVKTVWAMYFDAEGAYAGPVSDTILLDELPPDEPDPSRLSVLMNPPGQDDYLTGLPGAVEPFAHVTVYSNTALTAVLTEAEAGADGSFGPLNIGDNRVVKPQDYVYVTATDSFGRASGATPAYNDATPPDVRVEDVTLSLTVDNLLPGFGNPGDVVGAAYVQPPFYEPASDVTGGHADFSQFGGPSSVTMSANGGGSFKAEYALPASFSSQGLFYARVRVYDAAGNTSAWQVSAGPIIVDTIPPPVPTMISVVGDNRMLGARWTKGSIDAAAYAVLITTAAGYSQVVNLSADIYSPIYGFTEPGEPVPGHYPFTGLPNCNWYYVRASAIDLAGNMSAYSKAVSDQVILPPPSFEAWAALSGVTGAVAFSFESVENATGYELHFDTDAGVPYAFDSGGLHSPRAVTVAAEQVQMDYLIGLPLRTTFYLSGRARDDAHGTCVSAYSAEMSATTDLRVEAKSDGALGETMGGALALMNDYDGDGTADVLIGAPGTQLAAILAGDDAQRLDAFGQFWAPASYDIPGSPVAAADVDGDGRDEFIIGSPLDSPGGVFLAGSVRIYDDDKSLLAVIHGDALGLHLGFTVAGLGDLTGDGAEEFALGGFGCVHRDCGIGHVINPPSEGPGRVYVYGMAAGTAVERYRLIGEKTGDFFGISILPLGDVNGDAVNDFAVGAPGTERAEPGANVYLFSGVNGTKIRSFPGPGEYRFGASLARLQGVPGGNLIAIGSPGKSDQSGYVFAISALGFPQWSKFGHNIFGGPGFGATLSAGGDINGDGVEDLVVGAPSGAQSQFYGPGVAFVLDGKTGRVLYEMRGTGADGNLGYSVLSPGNLWGGPNAEWIVGAPGSGHAGYQSGRIYILTTDP